MDTRERERESKLYNTRVLVVAICIMGLFLLGYIIGPPLYWRVSDGLAAFRRLSSHCRPCHCNCSSHPHFSISKACLKHVPKVSDEKLNSTIEGLSKELKLREAEAKEKQLQADKAMLEAKKMASQYQKEADKCSSGIETCEEDREKAEAAVEAQKKITALWELRARQRGWIEDHIKSRWVLELCNCTARR